MPPKRKASIKKEGKKPQKQQKQDGQKAVSHDIDVPIDEGFNEDCEAATIVSGRMNRERKPLTKVIVSAKVYIDEDGIIFDASLNQTNIGGNNNKVRR